MFSIAISNIALQHKLEPGNSRWTEFNDSFHNLTVPSIEIISAIYMGHSFAAWHNGRRKADNFLQAQHIAVDLDNGQSIQTLMQNEFVQVYANLLYSTPSHTQEQPRTRVLFLLDEPITVAAKYKTAIGFLYSLFPDSDPSCVDCSRFFYGSYHCETEWPDNILPLNHLRSLWKQSQARKERPATNMRTRGKSDYQAEKLLDWAIQDAATRGRNNKGFTLAKRLQEAGLPRSEVESYLLSYQRSVANLKPQPYTEREVKATLRSAYH